jgi:hypothetical protein
VDRAVVDQPIIELGTSFENMTKSIIRRYSPHTLQGDNNTLDLVVKAVIDPSAASGASLVYGYCRWRNNCYYFGWHANLDDLITAANNPELYPFEVAPMQYSMMM